MPSPAFPHVLGETRTQSASALNPMARPYSHILGNMASGDSAQAVLEPRAQLMSIAQESLHTPRSVGGPDAWKRLLRDRDIRLILPGVACAYEVRPTPEIRARAFRIIGGKYVIACGTAAAWIYVGGEAPLPLHAFYNTYGSRPKTKDNLRPLMRQFFAPEVSTVGGLPVTSPARTFVDLARGNGAGFNPRVCQKLLASLLAEPRYRAAIETDLRARSFRHATSLSHNELLDEFERIVVIANLAA